MYSYKGGAGRTVATANVGALLAAEYSKRVVCIDLDIESAGLSVVFRVQHRLSEAMDGCRVDRGAPCEHGSAARRCLQDVLKRNAFHSDEEFEEWWPTLHFDVGVPGGLPAGALLFVPSRAAHYDSVEWPTARRVGDPLDDMLTHLQLTLDDPPDIVLLDSASGLTDPASVGLASADSAVVFLRWNRQFVQGTIDAITFFRGTGPDQRINDGPSYQRLENIQQLLLVPTAVPVLSEDEADLRHLLETNQRRLRVALNIERESDIDLLQPIRESNWLKLDERIFVFDSDGSTKDAPVLSDYRVLASRIVAMSDSERAAPNR